jgi:hypothetical protein
MPRLGIVCLWMFLVGGCDANHVNGALSAVSELAGSYAGHWVVQGLDANGQTFPAIAWDDTLEASNPRIERGRAVVSVRDVLMLPPPQSQMVVELVEGFHVESDGSAGARFFEVNGVETIEQALAARDFAFESALADGDRQLIQRNPDGLTDRSRHYSIRIVEQQGSVAREEVTRLTRAVWADSTSQTFISMYGYHERH